MQNLGLFREIIFFEGRSKRDYWIRFSTFLAISAVIATVGMLRDSIAVIIAAMLIAPLMTPILGLSAAMTIGLVGRILRLLLLILTAAGGCVILAWLLAYVVGVPRGLAIPQEVIARTNPGIAELIVALAAGFAGAYALIHRSEVSLVPGAAIGVSLVPPLSATGVLLYFDEYDSAVETFFLFITNFGAIVLSASAVFLYVAVRSGNAFHQVRLTNVSASLAVTIAVVAAIIVPLATETRARFQKLRLEQSVGEVIKDWSSKSSIEIMRIRVKPSRNFAEVWLVVDLPISAKGKFPETADFLAPMLLEDALRSALRDQLGSNYDIALRIQTRFSSQSQLSRAVSD